MGLRLPSRLRGVAAIGLIVLLLCAAPWLLFWSIGALFGVSVPFTFKTWLAGIVLLALVRGGGGSSS